jgi:type IX secretion system PorP/SprF family membrane protein
MNKLYFLILMLLAFTNGVTAQDQQFTQFYAVPGYINPAFAGASVQSRISAQYRNQWAAIPGGFSAFNLAYDQYLPNINSGMGLFINYDKAGTGGLKSTGIHYQYAYEARIKRNWFFRPALQFGYVSKAIDMDKLTFYDQMVRDNAEQSVEYGTMRPSNYFDFGTGLLTYSQKFWFGVAAFHNNNPDQSFSDAKRAPVMRKYGAHGGIRVRVKSNSLAKLDNYIVVAANFQSQQEFDQLDLGVYYELSPVVLGLWYRGLPIKRNGYNTVNHDAVAVLFGFQAARYKIGYSYDVTISKLGISNSAGSHELSLVYQWANKSNTRSKKIRIMPCAKF